MTTYHVWDNYVGAPSSNSSSQTETMGTAFTTSAAGAVTHLRWRAMDTNTAHKPTYLALWDGANGSQLAEVSSITHSGVAGWQDVALSAPVQLSTAHRYVASMTMAPGSPQGYSATNASAPVPLAWSATKPKVTNGGAGHAVYPDSEQGNYWWVDVVFDDSYSPPPGGDVLTVQEAVTAGNIVSNSWLSSTGNDYPTVSTPYLTWNLAQAIQTIVSNIPQAGDSDWTVIKKLWQIAGVLTDAEIAAWNLFAKRSPSQLTGVGGGGGSAFFGSGGHQVAQSAEDTLALVQLTSALQRNALVGFPGSPWVQTDSTAFDTNLAWAVEADLYVVSFSNLGSARVNTVVAGVDVAYRLAWWCPLIGAAGQQRRFIDFPDAHLWLDGQRMPGLLLRSPAGGTGTVQAWTYS